MNKVRSQPVWVGWQQILGAGMLGGIGFAMSLFIANLAFGSTIGLETAKDWYSRGIRRRGIARAIVLLRK